MHQELDMLVVGNLICGMGMAFGMIKMVMYMKANMLMIREKVMVLCKW